MSNLIYTKLLKLPIDYNRLIYHISHVFLCILIKYKKEKYYINNKYIGAPVAAWYYFFVIKKT